MTQMSQQIILASRPVGDPNTDGFKMVEGVARVPEDGEVLCRSIYLSLDPYMRGRMSAAKSYAKPVEVGDVMEGGAVGEVLKSKCPGIETGDFVLGAGGWQEYFTLPGASLRKIDPERTPISTALGVLGMPGVTAYTGLLNIGKPESGETVVVAAASGAGGAAVGPLAEIKGARAVRIAGPSAQCGFVVDGPGFDGCINLPES